MTIFYGGQQAFKDKILFFSTVVQYSKIGSKSGIRTGFERKNVDNFQAAQHTDLRHIFKDKTNCHFSSRSLFKILIFSGQSTCRPRTVFLKMKFWLTDNSTKRSHGAILKIKLMTIVQKDFKNNVLSIFQAGQLADPEQWLSLGATSRWLVGASRSPPWSTWSSGFVRWVMMMVMMMRASVRVTMLIMLIRMRVFLSDPSPIIGNACQWLPP